MRQHILKAASSLLTILSIADGAYSYMHWCYSCTDPKVKVMAMVWQENFQDSRCKNRAQIDNFIHRSQLKCVEKINYLTKLKSSDVVTFP